MAITDGDSHGERHGLELLTVAEMARADQLAIDGGVSGSELMAAAGAAVAQTVRELAAERPSADPQATPRTLILCGPGNNGGDGFVAARLLAEDGWLVTVGLLGDFESLRGDARGHAERWRDTADGRIAALDPRLVDAADIVVDALFGAGLNRPLEGVALACVEAIEGARQKRNLQCVAVDVPSGIDGDRGQILGAAVQAAVQADVTVTFFRNKPAHFLLPGCRHCGRVVTADIGIPETVLSEIAPTRRVNHPTLWLDRYPWPQADDHKYSRGAAIVVGGAKLTGAARLAAHAARRAGAGLVSIACSPEAAPIYRSGDAGATVREVDSLDDFQAMLTDTRFAAILVGPGAGVGAATADRVLAALQSDLTPVLDADALTSFEADPERLFAAIKGAARGCVLTPHAGEFTRLFGPADPSASKCDRVGAAVAASGAVVLLKGADTVIGAPDGRIVIADAAPPELATAGSGDVLAGFVVALVAQGMPAFEAAAAGAWLHGAAAKSFGTGLIAEDLADQLPAVLTNLAGRRGGDR